MRPACYLDKVVEEVDPLLQGLLQVLAESEVLGVLADLLHPATLCLLSGLLRPVLVVIITILKEREQRKRRSGPEPFTFTYCKVEGLHSRR